MGLRTLYGSCTKNTSSSRKVTFLYMYDLCALSDLSVQIRIFRVIHVLRTYMNSAIKATFTYKYGFACKATYFVRVQRCTYSDLCVRGTALRVKQLIIQDISWLSECGDDSQWQLMDASFTVVMTVDVVSDCYSRYDNRRWIIIIFFDRPNSLPRRIFPKDATFRLFSATILTSDWAVLLEGCDLPYFLCGDLDLQMGHTSSLVFRVPPSVWL